MTSRTEARFGRSLIGATFVLFCAGVLFGRAETIPPLTNSVAAVDPFVLRAVRTTANGTNDASMTLGRAGLDWLSPGSLALRVAGAPVVASFVEVGGATNKEWRQQSLRMVSTGSNAPTRWNRQVVSIDGDLFVIYDDLSFREPAEVELRLQAAPQARVEIDEAWSDLLVKRAEGEISVHCLAAPKQLLGAWRNPGGEIGLPSVAYIGTTNRCSELRLLTIVAGRQKGGTGRVIPKLLESEDAFGARIHRDGLPTLVAFRRDGTGAEANLAGLKFAGPIAVEIFHPRRRRE